MWMIVVLGIVAVCILCFVYWRLRWRRLRGSGRKRVMEAWIGIEMTDDPAKKVLEADNIFGLALQECGYRGSVGEKLRTAGARIRNINDVWYAHKLRNRIAHEPGVRVSDQEARRAVEAIRRAIDAL